MNPLIFEKFYRSAALSAALLGASALPAVLSGAPVSGWGFEPLVSTDENENEVITAYDGGLRLAVGAAGAFTLSMPEPPSSANVGDARVRGGFDRVTLEPGDSAKLTGGFTLSTRAQVNGEEEVLEGFETPLDEAANIGFYTNNTSSDPGLTLSLSEDSSVGESALSAAYSFVADAGWGGSVDVQIHAPEGGFGLADKEGLSLDFKTVTPIDNETEVSFAFKLMDNSEGGTTIEPWEFRSTAVITDDSGEWQTLILPFDDFVLNSWETQGNGELDLDALTGFEFQVVVGGSGDGLTYTGTFLIDNLTAYAEPVDADVWLGGVETRMALIDTGETGGQLGSTDHPAIWVGADGVSSGYMTVLRTGGDANWASGKSGPAGAVVGSNWVSTFGNNVGLGGDYAAQVEDEESEEEGALRDPAATAGDYTFEITVTQLWDSRSLVEYDIRGGGDGYVLTGTVMDRGAGADGTVATTSFNAVAFRFNNSAFTDVAFEDVTVTVTEGEAPDRVNLFTFGDGAEGWANGWDGHTATIEGDGEGRLAIRPNRGGFHWAANVVLEEFSIAYEAVREAIASSGQLNPLGIEYEFTLLEDNAPTALEGGWFAMAAAMTQDEIPAEDEDGSPTGFWHQQHDIIKVDWNGDYTEKGVLPLADAELNPDTGTITLVLGVNNGLATDAELGDYTVLVDNVRIVELEITGDHRLSAAGDFFGSAADDQGMVTDSAMGILWANHYPWVYSYNLHDLRGGTPEEPRGWLYAYGSDLTDMAWFYDFDRTDWWLTVGGDAGVYPWVYSALVANDWVFIEAAEE